MADGGTRIGSLDERSGSGFEETLEHPDCFLVECDATDHEILTFGIVDFTGDVAGRFRIGDELLVGGEELADIILLGAGGGELAHLCGLSEAREATVGVGADGADPFGDLVDGGEEFLVLLLEGRVQGEEARAFDIPMGIVSEGHEGVGIGEHLVEAQAQARIRFGGGWGWVGHGS
jgi:ribosomal protein S18 acetylase RimI-like enzyme